MADEDTWEDLAKRLAALVAKIDERDTHMVERLEHHEAHMARLDTLIEEQREFNRQQLAINADLKTLLAYLRYHDKGATYAKALLVEATTAQPDHEAARAFLEALGP